MTENNNDIVLNRRQIDDKFSKNRQIEPNPQNEQFPREPKKNPRFSKMFFAINLIFVIIFISYLFLKGIFPLSIRFIFTILIALIELLIYRRIYEKRKWAGIFAIGFMSFMMIFTMFFILVVNKVDATISRMNRNSIAVNSTKNIGDSFNIYISGIDTSGDVGEVSRSDVNIIATINTKTGKVLLTSVPRDTYLPIAEGGNDEYDKLTHAGIYGVTASVKTLENFFDTSIPYFARVNFDSVISMVDIVGGITINNPNEFVSSVDGKLYSQGNITLDGQMALAYVRERYNLPNGDLDRGKNQERVIAAIMKKIFHPRVFITKFDQILKGLEEAVDTNIQTKNAINIANSQLFSFGRDNIDSQSIEGDGAFGLPSYAMPGYDLYMFVPYESSVESAKSNIREYLR